jgi:hypothetical protein
MAADNKQDGKPKSRRITWGLAKLAAMPRASVESGTNKES